MNAILLFTAIFLLFVPAFALVVRKLFARTSAPALSAEWLDGLSSRRYKPMERLLENCDFEYLESQNGHSRKLAHRVRAERLKLFRMYARCLDRDFNRICIAIKVIMIHSQVDRPDLAALLLKTKFAFTISLVAVEYRLLIFHFGVGQVDVRPLVSAMDALRLQLRELTQVAQPLGAAA